MKFRHLSVVFWIGACLLTVELALEYRAAQRGWGTFFFGGADAEEVAAETGFGATDEFPFRSPIVGAARTAGVKRVWMASSSYAQDKRQPVPVVFPNQAATLLTESGLAVEMLNCSRNGLVTDANRRDLEEFGADWSPDVVVLYQMTNDLDRIGRTLHSGGEPPAQGEDTAAVPTGEGDAGLAASIQMAFEESTLYQQVKSNATARLTAGRQLSDVLDVRADAWFERDLRRFIGAARAIGAEPVLCTFPTSHTRENRSLAPAHVEHALLRFNLYLSLDAWVDAVERLNRLIRRVAEDEDVPVIDLAVAVGGQAEHFRDFSHLKPSGHELVAEVLADGLRGVLAE